MAFHNFSSSSMRSPHATFSNVSVPTGVLRIFTSGESPILGGHSHAWFHTRVFPMWNRIPAPSKRTSHGLFLRVRACRPRTRHRGTRRGAPLAEGFASLRTKNRRDINGSPCRLPRCCGHLPNGHRAHFPTHNVSELRRRIGQKEPTHGAVALPPTWSASQSGRGHQHRFRQLTER